MTHRISLIAACFALTLVSASVASACAWPGGAYSFKDHGIYGDFTINGDCTEMVWSRLSDGPETAALVRTKHGWKAELSKAAVELMENGHSLRVNDYGGVSRTSTAQRTN